MSKSTTRRSRVFLSFAAAIACAVAALPAPAATPEEVDAAVTKAKDFLYKHENADGNWEEVRQPDPKAGNADVKGKQWGGLTAIVTYALLAANENPQTQLGKAIDFLKQANLQGIYATGLRCQSWLLDDEDKKLAPAIERDKQTLKAAIHLEPGHQQDDSFGFYAYYFDGTPQPTGWYDRSVSQYGVLGMWALEQAGAEVPTSYWKFVDSAWRRSQNADGGWAYQKGREGGSTITMTAAGIATLFITQDYTLGNIAECRGNIVNVNIEHGLAWMDKNIHPALSGNYYGMYGIERIGVASGRKYFETVDWYQAGSDFIVKNQNPDGSWGAGIPDTCFAMLFLVRGKAPVVMNKLEYSITERNGKAMAGSWNERPRDCANFARWMGKNIEHDLNWQIVNLKVGADELHDSPILYISGNNELLFSDSDIATLRTFAEQGGLILGNADCGKPAFAKSFEGLGKRLFPNYKFRELPANHVIYTGEQYLPAKSKTPVNLLGLSNGVRELMLLVPDADLSRAFQARNSKTHAELYQLAANIFLYSVDKKNLQDKGDTYILKEKPEIKATRTVTVGRLQVGENWGPEPAGWVRLAALLHNQDKVDVTVKPIKCDADDLKGVKIAHLTGTTAITFDASQRIALKDFVEAGGTLIVDAAGGNTAFADAIEAELKQIFGAAPQVASPASQFYMLPDSKIEAIKFRLYAKHMMVGDVKVPRVRTIEIKGRPAVFYSREDLSAGIVGEQVDGIVGYDPATSTAIVHNIVMFGAFGFPKPPATQSTTRPATVPGAAQPVPPAN